ncbi:hypothetical protein EBZ80_16990 [bacterium]|nr:hypothetical protein [bacterium]
MDALQLCLRLPEALVREIWQQHLSATERLRLEVAWRLEAYDRQRDGHARTEQPRVMTYPRSPNAIRLDVRYDITSSSMARTPPLWLQCPLHWLMRETVTLLSDKRNVDMEWTDLDVWCNILLSPTCTENDAVCLRVSTVHCREIGRLGEATWCVYGARVHPRPPNRAWLIGAPMSGWKKRLCNEFITKVLGDQFRFREHVRST